jgi:cold shock protein
MPSGTVKFFNNSKGFGFIKSDESGEDVFVHVTGLKDDIRENDKVTFEVERGPKGLSATNVRLA